VSKLKKSPVSATIASEETQTRVFDAIFERFCRFGNENASAEAGPELLEGCAVSPLNQVGALATVSPYPVFFWNSLALCHQAPLNSLSSVSKSTSKASTACASWRAASVNPALEKYV
jgi:hypothetical protein